MQLGRFTLESTILAHERMPEAEVSLRLAIHLITSGRAVGGVTVAIDGAQVKTGETIHFSVVDFLRSHGWEAATVGERWQGCYQHHSSKQTITIHSRSGLGDVVATFAEGVPFVAEAKKGPLKRSASSQEYPLLREALGQLLTIQDVPGDAVLAVAVPHSEKFAELAFRWRAAPLVKRVGIRILTVAPDGVVAGW